MNDEDFERALQEKLGKFARLHKPERDLWPGVAHALGHPPHVLPRKSLIAVAAVVCLALVFFGWKINSPHPESALLAQLNENHRQQMLFLYTNLEEQKALTENWQQQLSELDRAAQDILDALEHDPGNIDLLKMLKNVYQQQLNLVERVHEPKWQYIYDINREVTL